MTQRVIFEASAMNAEFAFAAIIGLILAAVYWRSIVFSQYAINKDEEEVIRGAAKRLRATVHEPAEAALLEPFVRTLPNAAVSSTPFALGVRGEMRYCLYCTTGAAGVDPRKVTVIVLADHPFGFELTVRKEDGTPFLSPEVRGRRVEQPAAIEGYSVFASSERAARESLSNEDIRWLVAGAGRNNDLKPVRMIEVEDDKLVVVLDSALDQLPISALVKTTERALSAAGLLAVYEPLRAVH